MARVNNKSSFAALIGLFLVLLGIYSGPLAAHGNHSVINGQKAISIVAKTVKKMTFKDLNIGTGKLDKSWKTITEDQVTVVTIEKDYYVVKANHPIEEKTLFFKVANNGNVLQASKLNDFSAM